MNSNNLNFVIPFLLCILMPKALFSQSGAVSKSQFFDEKYKIIKNSLVHNDSTLFRMIKESQVRILKSEDDSIFIQLRQYGEVDVPDNSLLNRVEKTNEVFYILISEGTDKLKFTDFDISPLVIPLKIRPVLDNNPLQFLGDVAIGPYFGFQQGSKFFKLNAQPTQTTTTFCAFGSPTMINLNPANQNDSSSGTSSVLGLSAGIGILFDVNNLQFGLVGGWDWISGTASQTWIYQGKPWASFSFAYNLSNQ